MVDISICSGTPGIAPVILDVSDPILKRPCICKLRRNGPPPAFVDVAFLASQIGFIYTGESFMEAHIISEIVQQQAVIMEGKFYCPVLIYVFPMVLLINDHSKAL